MRKKEIRGYLGTRPEFISTHNIIKLSDEVDTYSALINFLPGTKELHGVCDGRELCLVSAGYKWLVYLPMSKHWCLTAFYNADGELFEWYFDISRSNFLDENGAPCIDDLYLDLVVFPSGQVVTLDADELQDALDKGEITQDDFNHAYKVHDQIKDSPWVNVEYLKNLCDNLMSKFECCHNR